MDQDLGGGLGAVNLLLVASGGFSLLFLCFCVISRQLSYVLWAVMLAAVAAALLLWPPRAIPILAVGIAIASLLVLISGIQAKRAHVALQQQIRELNNTVAALQGRLVLRLATLGAAAPALRPTQLDSPARPPLDPEPVGKDAENPSPSPIGAVQSRAPA
jgi:hypothetical protein